MLILTDSNNATTCGSMVARSWNCDIDRASAAALSVFFMARFFGSHVRQHGGGRLPTKASAMLRCW
jgi:hypothetical protein